jgi:hypothetical protein
MDVFPVLGSHTLTRIKKGDTFSLSSSTATTLLRQRTYVLDSKGPSFRFSRLQNTLHFARYLFPRPFLPPQRKTSLQA